RARNSARSQLDRLATRTVEARRTGAALCQRARRQRRRAGERNGPPGQVTSPSSPAASALKATPSAPDAGEPPFSPAAIEEWLRLIAKAGRAHQLYLPNNPIYRGAIDALRAGFGPIWKHTDEFTLAIGETEVRWYDVLVSGESNTEKNADNLAWLLYKDGL